MHCDGGFCSGNENNNHIIASDHQDDIYAHAGDDIIEARDRADKIFGQPDQDYGEGNAGPDNIHGDDGADFYSCGGFNCGLEGGPGEDNIWGGEHSDFLGGGAGASDHLSGQAGRDRLHTQGDGEADLADGGPDSDDCYVDPQDIVFDCQAH